jgi:hypothetical protein
VEPMSAQGKARSEDHAASEPSACNDSKTPESQRAIPTKIGASMYLGRGTIASYFEQDKSRKPTTPEARVRSFSPVKVATRKGASLSHWTSP